MSNKPGYKTTEVGEIPEEWEVVKLEDNRLAKKLQAGGTPLRSIKEYYGNGKIPFVRIEDMTMNEHYLYNTQIKITDKGLENSSAWLVPPNTILFSMYASYGEVVINRIPVATNQAIIAIIPQDSLEIEYLYYSLKQLKSKLYRHLRETTQKNLNAEIIRNLTIPLPSFPEQKKIASVLCCVDEAIQKTDEIIQKAQELKKGLMQQLLTKGIGHTKFKQTEIGEIPEEWKAKQLKEVVKFIKSGISREFSSQDIGYPVIRSTNIQDNRLNLRELKYWHLKDPQNVDLKNYIVEDGDILVNFINSIDQMGKCCIFRTQKRDFIYTTNILRVKLDQAMLLHDYFHYFVQTGIYKSQIYRISKLAVQQASFTHTDFQKIEIPIPPIEEQKKIVSILTELDEKIEEEKQRGKELQRLKKGLMQDLLTGRVRVKVS